METLNNEERSSDGRTEEQSRWGNSCDEGETQTTKKALATMVRSKRTNRRRRLIIESSEEEECKDQDKSEIDDNNTEKMKSERKLEENSINDNKSVKLSIMKKKNNSKELKLFKGSINESDWRKLEMNFNESLQKIHSTRESLIMWSKTIDIEVSNEYIHLIIF